MSHDSCVIKMISSVTPIASIGFKTIVEAREHFKGVKPTLIKGGYFVLLGENNDSGGKNSSI
ncbi:hypothetical protein GCM10023331_06890 [Algivirga pacifica]|uniref:DUF1330 domain-containing protein n=1 Tax=Algivirga pacifica TaxID=1162670 RepID=A0ABP9D8B0_9BACT